MMRSLLVFLSAFILSLLAAGCDEAGRLTLLEEDAAPGDAATRSDVVSQDANAPPFDATLGDKDAGKDADADAK